MFLIHRAGFYFFLETIQEVALLMEALLSIHYSLHVWIFIVYDQPSPLLHHDHDNCCNQNEIVASFLGFLVARASMILRGMNGGKEFKCYFVQVFLTISLTGAIE